MKWLERLLKYGPIMMTFIDDGAGGEAAGGGESAASDLSTAERALEFWDKPEGEEDPEDHNAAGTGDEGAIVEGKAEGQEGTEGDAKNEGQQLTDEQLQADPRFQELSKFQQENKAVFDKYGVPDAKELDLQLADSAVLYQIMQGKGTPSQLLDTMSQAAHWSKEQQSAVAEDLIGWLTKAGYLKDGQTQGGQARGGDGKFKDPLEARVEQVERERKEERERQTRADADQREAARRESVFKTYKTEIERLCKEKGIDAADVDFMGREIRTLVKPEELKAFTDAIEKNNFVKVRELFAQVHNREVARLKRWTASQTKDHERRTRSTPRVPAGGAPPAPAGQQKRNLSNREERLAAAASEWEK